MREQTGVVVPEKPLNTRDLAAKGKTLLQAKKEARSVLAKLLKEGDSRYAVHVMTYARLGGDSEMVPEIRERFARKGGNWSDEQVKIGAMHALIVLKGEKFSDAIGTYLKSEDVIVRSRALMMARDSRDASLVSQVKKISQEDKNPELRMEALSVLVISEGKKGPAYAKLKEEAAKEESGSLRAKIELAANKEEKAQALAPEEEEKLKQLVLGRDHDSRMYAIETLARRGSLGARGWLRRLGQEEDWHQRMVSAYYLLSAGESEEAQRRLETETQPMVQVTLLGALRAKKSS